MPRDMEEGRPKIEIVRVPSIERASFRPLDGVQLRAAYSHVRVGTYCPEPEPPPTEQQLPPRQRHNDVKPPLEQSRKYKKNLGPVSRLLRRRHHATSLATKSCDNIYSVNKSNSFFEWKHGQAGHDQGRQSNSLDWRVGRSTDKNSSNLEYRKASRSAEQLSRSGTLQTPSTKSKLVSLLKRLSPRLPRPSSKGSLSSSPGVCPWLQVEYTSPAADATDAAQDDTKQQQPDCDYSFQRELQLSEMRKRAIQASAKQPETGSGGVPVITLPSEEKSPDSCSRPSAQAQEKRHSNPSLRAVHEERGSSEERRGNGPAAVSGGGSTSAEVSGGGGLGRREVAGLLGRADSPGASLPRTSRRSRPHSLAVQPLNYQRLDPEQQLDRHPQIQHQQPTEQQQQTAQQQRLAAGSNKRPSEPSRPGKQASMTSQESIGSCSLDVERSASDRSDVNAGSLSEKTLHSLALSTCNGDSQHPAIIEPKPELALSNGHGEAEQDPEQSEADAELSSDEQLTRAGSSKKPSYLGLACSISGYSGITRYDSKLREGFRSRDSSPGARLIVRDTSPAGFRPNESQGLTPHPNPPKSQSISPLAMDRQRNGLANGVRDNRCASYLDSRTTSPYASSEGYSEVDRAVGPLLSPIRPGSPERKSSPVAARIASYNQHNKSISSTLSTSSPKSLNVSRSSRGDSSPLRNGSSDLEGLNVSSSGESEKSFIQQRVERLYGPGALAQGFYKRSGAARKPEQPPAARDTSLLLHSELDDDNAVADEAPLSLPVLRHLRPEFRAQLPVVSPRRPTDGSEQAIKPLKRMTLSPPKTDAKETKGGSVKQQCEAAGESKMTVSSTSITDQQPAAPEVVLPIIEPSVNATSVISQKTEGLPKDEEQEKDGHYYMKILNLERNRLLALSQDAEKELARSEELGLPEEASGRLRSAIGKTGLLATQRMIQFEGLCQMNINKVPGDKFPTTNQDLAGFWDMIMLQVIQVNGMFEAIEELRKSHWQEVPNKPGVSQRSSAPSTPQNGSAAKRRQTPVSKTKSTANAEANRKAREAREQTRRQLLEERRQAMRANAKKKTDSAIEIFVPET